MAGPMKTLLVGYLIICKFTIMENLSVRNVNNSYNFPEAINNNSNRFSSGKLQDLHHPPETRDWGPAAAGGGHANQGGGRDEGGWRRSRLTLRRKSDRDGLWNVNFVGYNNSYNHRSKEHIKECQIIIHITTEVKSILTNVNSMFLASLWLLWLVD